MTATTGQRDNDGELSALTVRAVVLASVVTFLIMIGLPAAWAIAAAH
jgi:hypothetical protein